MCVVGLGAIPVLVKTDLAVVVLSNLLSTLTWVDRVVIKTVPGHQADQGVVILFQASRGQRLVDDI